jgi:hypothetical protein
LTSGAKARHFFRFIAGGQRPPPASENPRAKSICPIPVLPFCVASGLWAQSAAINSSKPLSDRIVAYTIDAKLDVNKKTVDASETLAYRNTTGQPQDTFPFHLYLNAFRPESTFSLEAHEGGTRGGGEDKYPPEKIGGITVQQLTVTAWAT